jgi:hypothetical protein
MGPSVGRMIHYVNSSGEHWAAVVTRVVDADLGHIMLTAFVPYSAMNHVGNGILEEYFRAPGVIRHSMLHEPNTWHWPEAE